jgi:uncharacterized protein (TIGR02996 family)
MSERNAFLKALAENEDDTTTRLVYPDWLDEHGEHEEADRRRKWPAAKQWLVRFCRKYNPPRDGEALVISYEDLIALGRAAIAQGDEKRALAPDWAKVLIDLYRRFGHGDEELAFMFPCGNNEGMCQALRDNSRKLWHNWSIVTGIPVPPDIGDKISFACAC